MAKVTLNTEAFVRAVKNQSEREFKVIAKAVIAQMKSLMRAPKTGRVYNYQGRRHRASAPGQAPAIRSRELIRSIRLGSRPGEVVIGAEYASFLEEGTRFMAARPFVRPAVKAVRAQIKRGGIRSLVN